LALVTTPDEVEDIRNEWIDRYGPVPKAAETLLAVGLLRSQCHRLGLSELNIATHQARLGPIDLKVSETARLRRLSREAIHKEAVRQLVIPIPRGQEPASFLVNFLSELFPAQSAG
jgi:transcription-repair coupling factor (superfamily II helicase)